MIDLFDPNERVYGVIENGIGTLFLNRPDKRNAMTLDMWQRIPRVLDALEAEPEVSAILIRPASGPAFCAGADISDLEASITDTDKREANRKALQDAQGRLARSNRPTLAVIPGDCMGAGCGLALHADLRIAAPTARLAITPIKLGLVYPLEDQARLVDIVGLSTAKRMLFTGGVYGAPEAMKMGLLDDVAGDEGLDSLVETYVDPMRTRSHYSLHHLKAQFLAIESGKRTPDAKTEALFRDAHDGDDAQEGLSAFLEKRKPRFGWRRDG